MAGLPRTFPLSDETIQRIFLHLFQIEIPDLRDYGIPDSDVDPEEPYRTVNFDSLDTTKFPWSMLQVNRRWKRLTTENPQLWTMICVDPSLSSKHDAIRRRRLKKMLSFSNKGLSGNEPLPLQVVIVGLEEKHKSCLTLQRLMSASDRWETLMIDLHTDVVDVLDPISTRLGRLRRLKIKNHYASHLTIHNSTSWASTDDSDISDGFTESLTVFDDAPQLTSVEQHGFMAITMTLDIPWSQLTSYKSSFGEIQDSLRVLGNAPRLESFIIAEAGMLETQNISMGKITSPHMKRFYLSALSFGPGGKSAEQYALIPQINDILSCLDFPNLEHLNIRDIPHTFLKIETLLQNDYNYRNLKTLGIPFIDHTNANQQTQLLTDQVKKLLLKCTSLQCLHAGYLNRIIIRKVASNPSTLLPSLKELRFTWTAGCMSIGRIKQTLRLRCNPSYTPSGDAGGGPPVRLTHLTIDVSSKEGPADLERLTVMLRKEMAEKGLEGRLVLHDDKSSAPRRVVFVL